ncbi:MAG: sigma 54-interacting transcriptional regulator, partial [Bacteriovoracaceae bacterium]
LRQADGGILFLDEIATMPMSMQQKLLKALDEKTFYPVGSSAVQTSQFTLVSATCEDLFEKVSNNQFRKDLFYRISGLNFEISPLRSRPKDAALLIKSRLESSPRKIVVKKDALEALNSYSWPGNVRELIKTCDILTLKSNGVINLKDLPDHILMNSHHSDSEQNSFLTAAQKDFISSKGLKAYVKNLEKTVVKETLESNQGKIAKTIKDLRISSSAFYRVLESIR